MELPKKLQDDIWEYCRLNEIMDINSFIIKMVRQGFTIEKYGVTPSSGNVTEVEKIIEIPVEVIVEKIVEKEIYITNDEATKELTDKIIKLTIELDAEKSKVNTVKIKDIYGEEEDKKGFFGSNTRKDG